MAIFFPLLLFTIIRLVYVLVNAVATEKSRLGSYRPFEINNILPAKRRYRMRTFLFRKKIPNAHALFKEHYVDAKTLYVLEMDEVPCISFIGELDVSKAFAYIRNSLGADIKHTYQHTYFDHESKSTFFNNTIFVMANARMIELGNNYCHVLHSRDDYEWARLMLTALSAFRIATTSTQTQVIGFARQAEMN